MRAFSYGDLGWMGLIGTARAFTGSTSFAFAGANISQGWTVPAGVTTATAKLWGSAGTGRFGARGGYGGFCTGTFPVSAGQVMEVRIGFGGGQGAGSGNGGGYSWISYPSGSVTQWLIAAGGGGAGSGILGGDAGATGFAGSNFNSLNQGGSGAHPLAGGEGGYPDPILHTGLLLVGGSGTYSANYGVGGGGGGAGIFGGGGGSSFFIDVRGGGGGGGANLVSGVTAGLFVNTSGLVGFSDSNWNGSAGSGTFGYVYLSYS